MNTENKALSQKVYVGLLIAMVGACLVAGSNLFWLFTLAISVLVIATNISELWFNEKVKAEEFIKLRIFLIVASIIVIIFLRVIPAIYSSVYITQNPAGASYVEKISNAVIARAIVTTLSGPVINLIGFLIALAGLKNKENKIKKENL